LEINRERKRTNGEMKTNQRRRKGNGKWWGRRTIRVEGRASEE
jgi:hypothetical protein